MKKQALVILLLLLNLLIVFMPIDVVKAAGDPPVISNPFPQDGATGILTSGSPINVNLTDPDGDTMNVSVWSNHTGNWVQYAGWNLSYPQVHYEKFMLDTNSDDDWDITDALQYALDFGQQGNGTRGFFGNMSVTDDWGMTVLYTKYYWSVNVTDATVWTNTTYSFTTGAADPVVVTNTSTGVEETNATLHGYLTYDGGENCTVWFEYGTTIAYGTNTSSTPEGGYTEIKWSAAGVTPLGITTDGNYIWTTDTDNDEVYKYAMDGTYTGTHWDTAGSGNGNPWGITTDGNYIWITDTDDNEAYRYTMGGTYTTKWATVESGIGATMCIATDGNYIWTTDTDNDEVYKYAMDGTYTGTHWDTAGSGNGNPHGITTDGNYIWTTDFDDDEVYKYAMDGTYTGTHWDTAGSGNIAPWDITTYENYFFVTDVNDDNVYIYAQAPEITTTGNIFSDCLFNLTEGQLYHCRAVANNSNGTVYGSDIAFLTKPETATNFNVTTGYSPDTLNISWTKGVGANNTYIERNTSSSWNREEGTLIYNGTASYHNNTNCSMNTLYYYQTWSYTNWTYNPTIHQWSDSYAASSNTTDNVDPPYNGSSSYDVGTFTVNLTWTRGNHSDRDIVVQNNASYSTSPTDGWVRQNDTATFFNESINYSAYFTVWSYNDTSGYYSATGLNIPWGALALSCYNESDASHGIGFDIEISNSDFTTTYVATDLTNIHYVDMVDIPYGTGTIFQVSNSSYETRSYIYNIDLNVFYNLTFRLPLALPVVPDENITYAEDYVIHIVGTQTEYGVDPPIEDSEVIIRKYINTTEQYENIGVYVTSADGTFTVPLLPGSRYVFNISATGYNSEVDSWMPVEIVFEGDRHHTFRLTPSTTTTEEYDIFWDAITFTGVMNDVDGLNGTLTITYSDSNLSTTNTQIYVYEYWNGTKTLIATISNTSTNSFTYTTGVINTTRVHSATLFFNNTANFDVTSPVTIIINSINVWSERTPFDFEARARSIFGDAGFLYATAISAFLAIMAIVMFGPHNTGIGIIACGFTLGFTNWLFTALFTGGFNASLALYIPIIIIVGAMYILVKDPGGHL